MARLSQDSSAAATGVDSQETTPNAATEDLVRKAARQIISASRTLIPASRQRTHLDRMVEGFTGTTADTSAIGVDSQETTVVATSSGGGGAGTTAMMQAAWAGAGSWAIDSWKVP